MKCEQELCPNWDGEGCPCAIFGFEPGEQAPDGRYLIGLHPTVVPPVTHDGVTPDPHRVTVTYRGPVLVDVYSDPDSLAGVVAALEQAAQLGGWLEPEVRHSLYVDASSVEGMQGFSAWCTVQWTISGRADPMPGGGEYLLVDDDVVSAGKIGGNSDASADVQPL